MGLSVRFYNNEMWFKPNEIERLADSIPSDPAQRMEFFEACLSMRSRDNMRWMETPIAPLFLAVNEGVGGQAAMLRLQEVLQDLPGGKSSVPDRDLVELFYLAGAKGKVLRKYQEQEQEKEEEWCQE